MRWHQQVANYIKMLTGETNAAEEQARSAALELVTRNAMQVGEVRLGGCSIALWGRKDKEVDLDMAC